MGPPNPSRISGGPFPPLPDFRGALPTPPDPLRTSMGPPDHSRNSGRANRPIPDFQGPSRPLPDSRGPSRLFQDFRGAFTTPPDPSRNSRRLSRPLPDFLGVLPTLPGLPRALPTPPGFGEWASDPSRTLGASQTLPNFREALSTPPNPYRTSGGPTDQSRTSGVPSRPFPDFRRSS